MQQEETFAQRVGKKLATLREKKRLTQPQAAAGAKVSARSIWGWENGDQMPGARNLQKLADFYEVKISVILK